MRIRYFTSDKTVKIYVGPERKLWVLNEELLCDRIPYFKAAFASTFKEGREKVMEMPEDDAVAFGKLVNWIFTESIECQPCTKKSKKDIKEQISTEHQLLWCTLWILADKLALVDLSKKVLEQVDFCFGWGGVNSTIAVETVVLVYNNTNSSSLLRVQLLEEFIWRYFFPGKTAENKASMARSMVVNEEFAQDVLDGIQEHMTRKECIGKNSECFFHSDPKNSK